MTRKRDQLRRLRSELKFPVEVAARALGLNRSSGYYHTKPTEKNERLLSGFLDLLGYFFTVYCSVLWMRGEAVVGGLCLEGI